jgi:phospholipid/cholesterol/gamma-HCH transport system permease protein
MLNPPITHPLPHQWFPLTQQLGRWLWNHSTGWLTIIGASTLTLVQSARYVFQGRLHPKQTFLQAAFVGVDTLAIAFILTTVSGMILAMQLGKEMVHQGVGNFIGALLAMAIMREFAPVMTGFAVIAMAGSAFAAELSTMQITKQVDALRVLHVNPVRYLVAPRVVAAIVTLPLMTIITAFFGILGGLAMTLLTTDISLHIYLDAVWNQIDNKDIIACLTKAAVFGATIAVISTTIGLRTYGSSKDVGIATTKAVVWSFVAMAIWDYILTYAFYGAS